MYAETKNIADQALVVFQKLIGQSWYGARVFYTYAILIWNIIIRFHM